MMDAHTSAFDSAHGPFVWVDVNRIRQTYVCDGFLNDNDGTDAKGLSVTYDCNGSGPRSSGTGYHFYQTVADSSGEFVYI